MTSLSAVDELAKNLQSESWSHNGQFSYTERKEIQTELEKQLPEYELIGSGSTRIVIRKPEQETVYKINCIPDDSQNRTEVRIWKRGCENIPREHLAEVFDWTSSYSVVQMEYCETLHRLTEQDFQQRLSEIYQGYAEFTDEGAKDSWGRSSDGTIKCRDYGRAIVSSD